MSVNADEAARKYRQMGLEVERGSDDPGFVYERHAHGLTYLFIISGSLSLRLDDGDWREYQSGQEVVINNGQIHEAAVGANGWEYVAGD